MPVYVVIPQLPKGALIEWQVVAGIDVPKPLQGIRFSFMSIVCFYYL
jgi:hypothetical protein